jgi:shikimate kinase
VTTASERGPQEIPQIFLYPFCMILSLIGYRGTGKTTIAPLLAARCGCIAVDADAELERASGRTIAEIFATGGEAEFRRLERATIVELLKRDNIVLSVGGGAILNADTRRDLKAAGPVIWLKATPETISARMAADPVTAARRPNLTAAGGIDEIRQMLAVREPLYRETASLEVQTDGRSAEEIVTEITASLLALRSSRR